MGMGITTPASFKSSVGALISAVPPGMQHCFESLFPLAEATLKVSIYAAGRPAFSSSGKQERRCGVGGAAHTQTLLRAKAEFFSLFFSLLDVLLLSYIFPLSLLYHLRQRFLYEKRLPHNCKLHIFQKQLKPLHKKKS